MNTGTELRSFPNQDFLALVRAEQAAAGRPDVAIERDRITEDDRGAPFLLQVLVGTELSIPVRVRHNFPHARTGENLKQNAVEFAEALVNLRTAAGRGRRR